MTSEHLKKAEKIFEKIRVIGDDGHVAGYGFLNCCAENEGDACCMDKSKNIFLREVSQSLSDQHEAHQATLKRAMDREMIADIIHQIWCHWMQYQFKIASGMQMNAIFGLDNVSRWMRQMRTDYKDLSEEEKHSDRRQADKIIAAIDSVIIPKE